MTKLSDDSMERWIMHGFYGIPSMAGPAELKDQAREVLQRPGVTAEECRAFIRGVRERDDVSDLVKHLCDEGNWPACEST